MPNRPIAPPEQTPSTPLHTLREIYQQPLLWPTTLDRISSALQDPRLAGRLRQGRVLFTGAGTSAYAAQSIAAAWPRADAIATTDLLVDPERYLTDVGAVVSLARSGNSPESAAVVERIRGLRPEIFLLAITCNPDNALARSPVDHRIVLDPRTDDRSLVMTSSFSNLVLAGLALGAPHGLASAVESARKRASTLLPTLDAACERVAARVTGRLVVLSSSPLLGWAREAALKTLEMTGGHFPVLSETYLGLRHGPMSFVQPDTVLLCLLSADSLRRRYELDLVRELRTKKLGYLVAIADPEEPEGSFDERIPALLPEGPDELRTPFEIPVPQLLGYHLSRRLGLNPDSPSPSGVIHRVVQGVTIYPDVPSGAARPTNS
jgi:tagatose-6-phosphate ketose/aldose isomerase